MTPATPSGAFRRPSSSCQTPREGTRVCWLCCDREPSKNNVVGRGGVGLGPPCPAPAASSPHSGRRRRKSCGGWGCANAPVVVRALVCLGAPWGLLFACVLSTPSRCARLTKVKVGCDLCQASGGQSPVFEVRSGRAPCMHSAAILVDYHSNSQFRVSSHHRCAHSYPPACLLN